MPWEKQFDVDEALHSAMQAFWAHGYEATSMQDLVECMQINRGSLYATFGDKRSLFLQALRRYDDEYRSARIAKLRRQKSGKTAIIRAFEEVIDGIINDKKRDGCMLVNTALEISPHDPEIETLVQKSFADMEVFFREMIARAKADGEIAEHVAPEDTAAALLSMFIGLRVLGRSRPEAALLDSIVNQVRGLLV